MSYPQIHNNSPNKIAQKSAYSQTWPVKRPQTQVKSRHFDARYSIQAYQTLRKLYISRIMYKATYVHKAQNKWRCLQYYIVAPPFLHCIYAI